MTGYMSLFSLLKAKDGGNANFGYNSKGKVAGIDTIGNSSLFTNDVLLVEGLKHNFFIISQIFDKEL